MSLGTDVCNVTGCFSSKTTGVRLFEVKKSYTHYDLWVQKCNFKDRGQNKIFICEKHFEPGWLGSKKLKKGAKPTLFLPESSENIENILEASTNMEIDQFVIPSTSSNASPLQSALKPTRSIGVQTENIQIESATQTTDDDAFKELDLIFLPHPSDPRSVWYEDDDEQRECNNCLKKEKTISAYRRLSTRTNIKHQLARVKYLKEIRDLKKRNVYFRRLIRKRKRQVSAPKYLMKSIDSLTTPNTNSKTLCKMLLRPRSKSSQYSKDEKILSQNVFFRSPKTYKFLRDKLHLQLPSLSSLNRWQPVKHLSPGINDVILKNLQSQVKDFDDDDKKCALIMDEIHIKRNLQYNEYKDYVEGFVDLGDGKRKKDLANSICLFMVRGIRKNYKFPISFYASNGAIKASSLTNLLQANIVALEQLGFIVLAIVSDQGSNNRSTYKDLGATPDDPTAIINDRRIACIFDAPHLVKSIRNQLMSSNIKTPDGEVSWSVISEFYELDKKIQRGFVRN